MQKSTKIKFILFPILMFLGIILFYMFMTYDRNYVWSKEFSEKIEKTIKNTEFKFVAQENINVAEIKISNEKVIKLSIQKFLSQFNLMQYGKVYGQKIVLKSNTNQILFCKGWCLSDHVIGIEIQCQRINQITLDKLKSLFEKEFPNNDIVWTRG